MEPARNTIQYKHACLTLAPPSAHPAHVDGGLRHRHDGGPQWNGLYGLESVAVSSSCPWTPCCPVLHARSRGTAVGPREMLRMLIARPSAWHVVAASCALAGPRDWVILSAWHLIVDATSYMYRRAVVRRGIIIITTTTASQDSGRQLARDSAPTHTTHPNAGSRTPCPQRECHRYLSSSLGATRSTNTTGLMPACCSL